MASAARLRFSVLITNYNYGRYLNAAVHSALNQTYPISDLVVVDDGSTDDSAQVLDRLERESDGRVKVVRKPNGGQASAINAGVAILDGDVVGMMDADDLWAPNKAETVVAAFERNLAAGMVQHAMRRVDSDGSPFNARHATRLPSGDLFPLLVKTGGANVFEPTSALSFRREILHRITPLPESDWRLCADGALVYAAAVVGEVVSLTEQLADYRIHDANKYAGRRVDSDSLHRDLEMTSNYINEWASREGRSGTVCLRNQLNYRRHRFYESGGDIHEYLSILRIILSWPIYSYVERTSYALRFLVRGAFRLGFSGSRSPERRP
jgi:glycosyltransferase involved in cell wall biosynthesis